MPLTPPKFWDQPDSWLGYLLTPLSWVYQAGTLLHQKISKPYRAPVPVISIGNLVLGGAGKTPVTIAVAQQLQAMGRTPHIISRGYGGSLKGPIRVDLAHHQFYQVGDEPLLLARIAPTWVSKNRRAAGDLAIQAGADILLLDDGHQNYTLEKDMCLVVVNATQRFGNGRVFPAGPLRQMIQAGLKQASALVYISEDHAPLPEQLPSFHCPLLRVNIVPINPNPCAVLAFSGIGYPEKFHQTLLEAGYQVKDFIPFPDHHPYTEAALHDLKNKAHAANASLMTTEKDLMRLPLAARADVLTLPIRLDFYGNPTLETLLKQFLNIS